MRSLLNNCLMRYQDFYSISSSPLMWGENETYFRCNSRPRHFHRGARRPESPTEAQIICARIHRTLNTRMVVMRRAIGHAARAMYSLSVNLLMYVMNLSELWDESWDPAEGSRQVPVRDFAPARAAELTALCSADPRGSTLRSFSIYLVH